MKPPDLIDKLLAYQSLQGGFPSRVAIGDSFKEDENCFVTALIALELMEINKRSPDVRVKLSIEKALNFIEQCEETPNTGRYFFYPALTDTPRLDIQLSPDLDDSALALLVLLKGGRIAVRQVSRAVKEVFEANRQLYLQGTEPNWVQAGSFRTWIKASSHGNPVDCCVNANVLTLYAYAGIKHTEGYQAALRTICRAIRASDLSISAMRRLAPYYAHPAELFFAVKRALAHGATELSEVFVLLLSKLQIIGQDGEIADPQHPVCCNASGRPLWFSPALQLARNMTLMKEDSGK